MNWKFYNPLFEYENLLEDTDFPWAGHKLFAYDLIRNFKPNTIVELGTYKGTSLFSMAQALKDSSLKSKITAIDTWEGDKHSGYYDNDIYEGVVKIRNKYYKNINIDLLRTTFDKALKQFKNESIDLLHIDGLHTYEAVKHDFNNWFPKVKKDGVIMFHDTHEKMNDFGVYKLWEEVKKKYGFLDFSHSHGLGVIFLNQKPGKLTIHFEGSIEKIYQSTYQPSLNNIEIEKLKSLNANLEEKLKSMENNFELLNTKANQLKSIENSLSWKLTKPLRSLPFKRS